METRNDIVIVSYARTPIGSFGGSLSSIPATKLGAIVIKGAMEKINLSKDNVDQVIMGNVLSAGLGQAPARQAAIYSGLPESVECLTINKMCGSGLKAIMLAQEAILSGNAEIFKEIPESFCKVQILSIASKEWPPSVPTIRTESRFSMVVG